MSEILIGPVQGGPCKGAKGITAPSSWDGRVRDIKTGKYLWNAHRKMWVWKVQPVEVEKDLVRRRVTEAEFRQNAPRIDKRGKQPMNSRDWDLR